MSGKATLKFGGKKVRPATEMNKTTLGLQKEPDLTGFTGEEGEPKEGGVELKKASATAAKGKPRVPPLAPTAPAGVKTPAKAQAQAPPQAQAQAPAKAQAEARAPAKAEADDLVKYEAQIKKEITNPYKNKSERIIFPLLTRFNFQQIINDTHRSFMKQADPTATFNADACKKLSTSDQTKVEIYEYQKFVREYMRGLSPYRGLLVYHGLGSGKTCSAIAAAEALFSVTKKKIIVMTPASLRDNFIREISFCGYRHYNLQNHWTPFPIQENPMISMFARSVLQIPASFLTKKTQVWVPDFEKPSNYNDMPQSDKKEIEEQIQSQITNTFEFINYNGITASKLKEIACAPRDADGNGFFDNKTIVIDEIHNLTRLMHGTIEPYLTSIQGLKRKVPIEPIKPEDWTPNLCGETANYKRGYLLYRLLTEAKNSKIIGLSGTPLINFPEELGILVNLLGGYIHTASFTLVPKVGSTSQDNQKLIQNILRKHPYVDFEEVSLQGTELRVLLTLIPNGFQKVFEGDVLKGVERVDGLRKTFRESVTDIVNLDEIQTSMKVKGEVVYKSEPLLPPFQEEFNKNFITTDKDPLQNKITLRKRLQGLISYYRGSKKELMPLVVKDELVRIPFTPYAHSEYIRVRGAELDIQEKKRSQQPGQAPQGKIGNLMAEIYDLAKMKATNSYRMFSRQACNFAFPEGIVRPRPSRKQDVLNEIGGEGDDALLEKNSELGDAKPVAEGLTGGGGTRRRLPVLVGGGGGGGGEGEAAAAEEEAAAAEEEAAAAEEEAAAAEAEDAEIEEAEILAAKGEGQGEGEGQSQSQGQSEEFVPIPELPVVEAVGTKVPMPKASERNAGSLTAVNGFEKQRRDALKACKGVAGELYAQATVRAKNCLANFANVKLRLYAMGKNIAEEISKQTPPNTEGLVKYSPKYAEILKRIIEGKGSSLVYSQFLDMEGIGIFLIVLKINQFEPIVIEENGRFSTKTIESLKKGSKVNRYLSFTGKESRYVRSLALKVFNAKYNETEKSFPELPKEMSDVLVENAYTGNLKGELCRVFCITSAGAEGLSLRNVRRVHIMEPYWNNVRTEQVKGRAVRICSHMDLEYNDVPERNERTVEIFTYCSTFSEDALLHPEGSTTFAKFDSKFLTNDTIPSEELDRLGLPVLKGLKEQVITSDEYLYILSENKKKLLQSIQNLMKASAVDCFLNKNENDNEVPCLNLPAKTQNDYVFHPVLASDIIITSSTFKKEEPAAAAAAGPSGGSGAAVPAATGARKEKVIPLFEPKGRKYVAIKNPPPKLTFSIYVNENGKRGKLLGEVLSDGDTLNKVALKDFLAQQA